MRQEVKDRSVAENLTSTMKLIESTIGVRYVAATIPRIFHSVLSHNNKSYAKEGYLQLGANVYPGHNILTNLSPPVQCESKSHPKRSFYPRATFQHTCSTQRAAVSCWQAMQSYLLALYMDLLASRGSLLGLLQSSASGLVL